MKSHLHPRRTPGVPWNGKGLTLVALGILGLLLLATAWPLVSLIAPRPSPPPPADAPMVRRTLPATTDAADSTPPASPRGAEIDAVLTTAVDAIPLSSVVTPTSSPATPLPTSTHAPPSTLTATASVATSTPAPTSASPASARLSSTEVTSIPGSPGSAGALPLSSAPAPLSSWAPAWVLADDGGVAERLAQQRSDDMLKRAMNEPDLSPAQREGLQREAVVARSIGNEIRYVMDGVPDIAPSSDRLHATVKRGGNVDFVFAVLTGRASHADRVVGLHTLLQGRKVVWFSDEGHPLIKPVVPTSAFEADVCARNLAHDTQFKGCRYQRHFYWVLDILQLCAAAWGANASAVVNPLKAQMSTANETGWDGLVDAVAGARWLVKLSDDTLVILEHLERYVESLEKAGHNPLVDPVIAGKMERRNGYWFFSGGHPIVFARAALLRWGTPRTGDGYRCEGTVIDTGPAKLKKFWWWADDVLISHCIAVAKPAFVTLDLPGAISVERFRQAPLPPQLFAPVTYIASDASAVLTTAADARVTNESTAAVMANVTTKTKKKKKRGGGGLETRRTNVSAMPISYHAYPYIAPRQMFSLWHHLHPLGP